MDATRDGTHDLAAERRPSYEELVEENRRLRAAIRRLEAQVAELQQLVEKLGREGKRQAAPFRKQDQPATKPKKPGRKSGRRHGPNAQRAVPPRIDETYDVPLPAKCPRCGEHRVRETHVAAQYQTEIPRTVIYRRFAVHVGVCQRCGQAVEGRHALQTSTARGAAASQLGPGIHAALAIMNKQLGLSHGKCVKLLGTLFEGLKIARGTSARSIARTGKRCAPAYEQLWQDIRNSPQIVPDETGWRVGGRTAWLHAFVGRRETVYLIDPTRSGKPAEDLLGTDWSGTLVHDGWSVYDRFTNAAHQQCLGHLQRRCEHLLETAVRGAVRLPRAVLGLIDRAYALRRAWRGHRLSADGLAEGGLRLAEELEYLAEGRFTSPPNRRLAGHLLDHAINWFWFLIDPKVDATNYRGEQAIRPAVVNRKVWGGNRTWLGARWQSIITSLVRTCEQRALNAFDYLLKALSQPPPTLLPC
ncbi:MAG: IS66 family transposase [Bryobacteraceae bacterium]